MIFITVTRLGTGRQIPVHALAIAYLEAPPEGGIIAFASGESLRVEETPAEIRALIVAAEHPKAPAEPAPTETKTPPPAAAAKGGKSR